jgi:hypothetical protein
MAFGRFLLGSHHSMVAALGLCEKWPFVYSAKERNNRPVHLRSLETDGPLNEDVMVTLGTVAGPVDGIPWDSDMYVGGK